MVYVQICQRQIVGLKIVILLRYIVSWQGVIYLTDMAHRIQTNEWKTSGGTLNVRFLPGL